MPFRTCSTVLAPEHQGLFVDACVVCSCAAVETGWDDPLSETLEKEVEDARKMVSALQVHAD